MISLISKTLLTLSLALMAMLTIMNATKQPEPVLGGAITARKNVIGTGTSTSGTFNLAATGATTTSRTVAIRDIDTVDLHIYPESASTTARVNMQVLVSSLETCMATSTNAQDGWVDALAAKIPLSVFSAATTTPVTKIPTGTTTVGWRPSAAGALGVGKALKLEDLNADCMKVELSGNSVNLYIQAILRSLSL